MSKIKKVLLMCTAYVLVAVIAIGGTLAYLKDTDSDVNVMTTGNVYIEQIEQERNADGNLVDFTQNKAAIPAVGNIGWDEKGVDVNGTEYRVFDDALKNVIDKIVTVKNIGSVDAYVRTIVAIEAPDGDPNNLIHVNVNGNGLSYTPWRLVEIGGEDYVISIFTYDEALNPNEISAPSLVQLFLDSEATNEDCAAYGDTWEVLVVSQAVQAAGFDNAQDALNEAFGVPTNLNPETGIMLAAEWMDDAIATYEESLKDTWDGSSDISWYTDTDTEFTLKNAEQLAGLNKLISEGNNFAGKTVKLGVDVDMSGYDWVVANKDFSGSFDGQEHTVYNISRTVNTYTSGRMGLFGHIEGGTVKNLTVDSAAFYGYGPYGGVIAGSAYGECVFENITLTNCNNEMYNTGSAGIVGLAYSDSNYTFKNISIDDTNTIGSYWGSWDTASGGLIGYFWKDTDNVSPILVENCYIAPVLNVYNDVCASYQWYAYRYAGMLIGYVQTTTEVNGTTYPNPYTLICKNVTVEYGDWANYRYCEWEKNGKASYSKDYKFSREDNDNFDTHIHTVEEDNHNVLLVFDQLFGGGQGVYGDPDHEGVTIIYNNK